MDTGYGGKRAAREKAKKRKLFEEESEPSTKRWMRSDAKKNSEKPGDGGGEKKAMIENGNVKKRKLASSEDGKNQAKRRPDKALANEHGGKANIDILPGELLTKIIDMVPKSQWASLEFVNHRFQEVMHGKWGKLHKIRLDELVNNKEKKPHQLADAVLRKFLLRAPNVTSITGFAVFCNLRTSTSIRLATIQLLAKFELLESIDFSGREVITASNFAVFLESSASRQCWKSLDLDSGICGAMKKRNVVDSMDRVALKLEYFKFNMENLHIFDRFLRPIEWSGLKELVIVDSLNSGNNVLPIIRQCNQIGHLVIVVPDCRNGQPLYGEVMEAVANLKNLSVLKIFAPSWLVDPFQAVLLALIQNVGHRLVDFGLQYRCNDQILFAIIDHMKHLTSLDLCMGNCKTPSLQRLANEMVQLETLKLRYSVSKIDSTVIRAIVDNMNSLQCLDLGWSDVTLEDLKCLVDLRKLMELRITLKRSEEKTLKSCTRLGFGSSLETLELVFGDGISHKTVVGFFKNVPRLRCLILNRATDRILKAVALSCPNLVELEVGWRSSVTSSGFQSIIDRCTQLEILKVQDGGEWFPATLTVGKYRKITFINHMCVLGKYTDVVYG